MDFVEQHNARLVSDFVPYVTLRYIMFMFPTRRRFSVSGLACAKINRIFLLIKFRYDAQMPGYPAQCLRREKCIAAQGGKSSPFSTAEQRHTSANTSRSCVAFMPVSAKVIMSLISYGLFIVANSKEIIQLRTWAQLLHLFACVCST